MKLNILGETALTYKQEIYTNWDTYNENIQYALKCVIKELQKKGMPAPFNNEILNKEISVEEFKTHLMNENVFLKTLTEIEVELKERARAIIDRINNDVQEPLSYEVNAQLETIGIKQQFLIQESFIREYLGIDEKLAVTYMQPQNFAHTFTGTRVRTVLRNIVASLKKEESIQIELEITPCQYITETGEFEVDVVYTLDETHIDSNIEALMKQISSHYQDRMKI